MPNKKNSNKNFKKKKADKLINKNEQLIRVNDMEKEIRNFAILVVDILFEMTNFLLDKTTAGVFELNQKIVINNLNFFVLQSKKIIAMTKDTMFPELIKLIFSAIDVVKQFCVITFKFKNKFLFQNQINIVKIFFLSKNVNIENEQHAVICNKLVEGENYGHHNFTLSLTIICVNHSERESYIRNFLLIPNFNNTEYFYDVISTLWYNHEIGDDTLMILIAKWGIIRKLPQFIRHKPNNSIKQFYCKITKDGSCFFNNLRRQDIGTIPFWHSNIKINNLVNLYNRDCEGNLIIHSFQDDNKTDELKKIIKISNNSITNEMLFLHNDQGFNVFHLAIRKRNKLIVKEFLNFNINLAMWKDANGKTPLFLALTTGDLELINLLRDNSPPVDDKGDNIFHYLCEIGDVNLFNSIWTVKDVTAMAQKNINGKTPFHLAVSNNNEIMVKKLCQLPFINKDITTSDEQNIFHLAIKNNNIRFIMSFIHENINIFAQCNDSFGPTYQWLLFVCKDQKAIINSSSSTNNTALHLAAWYHNCYQLIFLLLVWGFNRDWTNNKNMTPLHLAVIKGHHRIIPLLLTSNNVNLPIGVKKWAPLHLAVLSASENKQIIIKTLLQQVVIDKNIVNSDGNSALSLAILIGDFALAQLLIINGVNIQFHFTSLLKEVYHHLLLLNNHNDNVDIASSSFFKEEDKVTIKRSKKGSKELIQKKNNNFLQPQKKNKVDNKSQFKIINTTNTAKLLEKKRQIKHNIHFQPCSNRISEFKKYFYKQEEKAQKTIIERIAQLANKEEHDRFEREKLNSAEINNINNLVISKITKKEYEQKCQLVKAAFGTTNLLPVIILRNEAWDKNGRPALIIKNYRKSSSKVSTFFTFFATTKPQEEARLIWQTSSLNDKMSFFI